MLSLYVPSFTYSALNVDSGPMVTRIYLENVKLAETITWGVTHSIRLVVTENEEESLRVDYIVQVSDLHF